MATLYLDANSAGDGCVSVPFHDNSRIPGGGYESVIIIGVIPCPLTNVGADDNILKNLPTSLIAMTVLIFR